MEYEVEQQVLEIFRMSVSNNFEEVKASEEKIKMLYNDMDKDKLIKMLMKFILYPVDPHNPNNNLYNRILDTNVKMSILISVKNWVKKSVESDLDHIKLTSHIELFLKHICLHGLLDIYNDEIRNLERHFFEILFVLFKYNICDDYDYIIFYIILIHISDYPISELMTQWNYQDKKNNSYALNVIESLSLYKSNQEILRNMMCTNFNQEYSKLLDNIEKVAKHFVDSRNESVCNDINNYIANTKKVYKFKDHFNMFGINDCYLFKVNDGNEGLHKMNNGNRMMGTQQENCASVTINNNDFDFLGKGTLLNDYNYNVKIIDAIKNKVSFKNVEMTFFQNKFRALKVLRKILKNYNDSSYNCKYDLKIILTHIEFPITLYFVYIYNKFKEFNQFINYQLNEVASRGSEEMNEEMERCFYVMNELILNAYMILKIFHNIHMVDLPEYFEDNIEIYFNVFYNMLVYDISILKNYFQHVQISKERKTHNGIMQGNTGSNTNSSSGIGWSLEQMMHLQKKFETNLTKVKMILTDIIKVYADKYQEESKQYILKLIFSLSEMLYREKDRGLLCHTYNCLSSTVTLIHHMNLAKSDQNPYKDRIFLEKLLDRVLQHIKLKINDIEEMMDADLEYFKNDLNNVNSFSVRSTAIHFLKTLCSYYFDLCIPFLENRIMSRDSLSTSFGLNTNINTVVGITEAQRKNEEQGMIDTKSAYYEPCNFEYKMQLITCLNQPNMIKNFFDSNLKNMLSEIIMVLRTKYPNVESVCFDIQSFNFESPSFNATANKRIWLETHDIMGIENMLFLLSILKFLMTSKGICTMQNISEIFTFFYYMLYYENNMIHNYSYVCIHRVLNERLPLEVLNVIAPITLGSIVNRLLFIVKYDVSNGILNEYPLFTLMSIIIKFPSRDHRYLGMIVKFIDDIIKMVINQTYNPVFNHYLFELLMLVMKRIYKTEQKETTAQIENIIITTFAQILELYVHDFIPYIFQILSVVIENTFTVQEVHVKILSNLYEMDFWKSSVGNANGIMCVLRSYFKKYNLYQQMIGSNMERLFSLYQYCLGNSKLMTDSFQIIMSILVYLPIQSYQNYVKPLLVLLFTYLQQYKNEIFKIKVMHAISVLVIKSDETMFVNVVESIQPGLIMNVLKNLYMPILDKLINTQEKAIVFIAVSKILNHEKVKNTPLATDILECLNRNLVRNELVLKKIEKNEVDEEKTEIDSSFEIGFSKLTMMKHENFNDLILNEINAVDELKSRLLNVHFYNICQVKKLENILELMNR